MSAPTESEREHYMMEARKRMIKLAGTLEPRTMGVATFEGESLVLMLRLIVVDFMEATGISHKDAVDVLVPLGEAVTQHAPRTSAIPIVDTDMDDPMAVNDMTNTAVNAHRTNKLNTRSINIMLHENEEESRS